MRDIGVGDFLAELQKQPDNFNLMDLVLNVKSISFGHGGGQVDGPGSISLAELQSGFEICPISNIETNQMHFMLALTGNFIVLSNWKQYNLETVSQIKVLLGETIELTANQKYVVKICVLTNTKMSVENLSGDLDSILKVLDIQPKM
jgi:hypothetical protein